MSKKKSGSNRSRQAGEDDFDGIVLGTELAAAEEAEQRRRKENPSARSPMPAQKYRIENGGMPLLHPRPQVLDSLLVALSERYARSSDQERAALRSAISMDEFYTLLAFARRAAVFALREKDTSWVIHGLTAVAMIEAERVDWRDILVALGLLHHAATRTGRDGDQVFREVSVLAEPGTRELMVDFARRPERDKRLSAWCFEEVETAEGVGLIQGGFGRTRPTYDLISLAQDIADYLAKDVYRPSSIDFGEEIPRVWLETPGSKALDKALKACRTGVTIHAEMRRKKGIKAQAQHFAVFLQEMKTEEAAQQLLDIARKKKPTFFCKVELAAGRLFCLIIARSWWEGVDAYETPASLQRFARPIGDILQRYAARPAPKRGRL